MLNLKKILVVGTGLFLVHQLYGMAKAKNDWISFSTTELPAWVGDPDMVVEGDVATIWAGWVPNPVPVWRITRVCCKGTDTTHEVMNAEQGVPLVIEKGDSSYVEVFLDYAGALSAELPVSSF